ncbi:MAG: class I SAM-dependent methyltransferase [Planctomycetota bacterium]
MRPEPPRALRAGLARVVRGPLGRGLARHVLGALREERPAALLELVKAVFEVSAPEERRRVLGALRGLQDWDNATVEYGLTVFRGYRALLQAELGRVAGARVLELGPGHTLVPGVLLHAAGAARYAAVDPYPVASLDPEVYRELRRQVACPAPWEPEGSAAQREFLARLDGAFLSLEGERARLDPERVSLHALDAARTPFPAGSFDAVLSNATLEHVTDPDGVLRESWRLLAPGGFASHQIDFSDHRSGRGARDFLQLDAAAWEREIGIGFEFTNRWRLGDFVAASEALGFRVTVDSVHHEPLAPDERNRLHADFRARSDEDLSAVSARLLCRKPA